MAPKLDLEARMTIKALRERGSTALSIAGVLGVTEGAVRCHLRWQAAGARDRARQVQLASRYDGAIVTWLEGRGTDAPVNLVALHAWLVEEHGYPGSARSV
jgi:predicted transcriptional regulator